MGFDHITKNTMGFDPKKNPHTHTQRLFLTFFEKNK